MNYFDRMGGEPALTALVERFYEGVEHDALLRPMYPDDLGPPIEHLRLFLIQYWGGPTTYTETRGHPRLRLRHQPFAIGSAEGDAWLGHMRSAIASLGLEEELSQMLEAYFVTAARGLINRPQAPSGEVITVRR
ncbi:MAG TPA: globin [Candidatus Acidoferrales bacterium]|nr:globin [Candidatus Acidoferrales bacterium]